MISRNFTHNMYCTGRNIVDKNKDTELYFALDSFSRLAKNLSNAAIYRLRQNFTSRGKDVLSPNQKEILSEIDLVVTALDRPRPKAVISYPFLEKMMRLTENPDFFSGLPMQTAQYILKDKVNDFKNWLSALRSYHADPKGYTGKPKMPGYIRREQRFFTITNQDCVINRSEGRTYLKFPKTKAKLKIQELPHDAKLKEVKVIPYYGTFEILYTYETKEEAPADDLSNSAGLDIGVDNIAAIAVSNGSSLLIKGGAFKSENRRFNMQRAKYISILTKGHETRHVPATRMLCSLSKNRALFLLDACHQVSCRIVSYCLENKISTLYIGRNRYWKQRSNLGKTNNQSFVQIPFDMLTKQIVYKAERKGIRVIMQEESYTSKASFLDNDYMPVFGVDDGEAHFSGKRLKRGLYRSSDGTVVNADINAAANILRKASQDAFKEVPSADFLKNPQVIYFADLHKRNAVEGIAAE
ncbi:MAG: transposase [Firmicutes bacterium]|nr:transposase [Bacillota bacterium]